MKHKALRGLRIVLGVIIVLVAGGGQRDGFSLVVQQIQIIGPRQWLGLMAGSIVAPLTERIARSLPTGDGSDPYGSISVIYVG
jgi:hypothetical protein